MKYAAHSLMWTPEFREKDFGLLDKPKGMDFDGIENRWISPLCRGI